MADELDDGVFSSVHEVVGIKDDEYPIALLVAVGA